MDLEENLYQAECWDHQDFEQCANELLGAVQRCPAASQLARVTDHFCSFRPNGHPYVVPNMEEVIFETLKRYSTFSLARNPEREDAAPQNWQVKVEFRGTGALWSSRKKNTPITS